MSYLAVRGSTLFYAYGASTYTVPAPQTPRAVQPYSKTSGAAAFISATSQTMNGFVYATPIRSRVPVFVVQDLLIDMNISGNLGYNDYASCYASTSQHSYLQDVRSFEATQTFWEGSNKSILHYTSGSSWALIDKQQALGWVFESAANVDNDLVVPYSRAYGFACML